MDKTHQALQIIAQAIYDKKGMNAITLDLRGISSLADYFIIAEGNVDRHVKAIAGEVRETLKSLGWQPFHAEGEASGDWIVLDYGEIMIHLFTPELRERYALERLWKQSKIVNVKIKESAV